VATLLKRWLHVWPAALFVLLVLAACGGDDSTAGAEGDTPEASTAQPGVTADAESAEPVTLTIWDTDYVEGQAGYEAFSQVDKLFMERNPNVTIEHVGFPFAAYWPAKVQAAVATKQGPDIVSMFLAGASSDLLGSMWPVRDLLTDEMRETVLLLPQQEQSDPSVHQLPFTIYAYIWLYNKEMFAQAGLDPESPPATWDELMSACDQLQGAGVTPIAGGFKDGWLGQWYVTYGFASQLFSSDEITDWATGDIGWTHPKMEQAVTHMSELAENGCFGESPEGFTLSDADTLFSSGKAAMQYTCTACLDLNGLSEKMGDSLGVFRMPTLEGSAYTTQPMDIGPSHYYAITGFTENCGVAWDYLSFILSAEAQQIMWDVGGALPNVTTAEVSSTIPVWNEVLGWLRAEGDHHTGPFQASPQERDLYVRLYPELIAGRMSPTEVVEQLEELRSQHFATSELAPEEIPSCD
jgi:ABC-type glycerol-3-phosphate transport system substrate-binding protein